MRALRIPVLMAVLSMAFATTAQAAEQWAVLKDRSVHNSRPQTLDIDLTLGAWPDTHVGIAGWYGYPVVPNGFIPAINDALYIEAGAAIERYSNTISGFYGCDLSSWAFTPMGGARYQVYLTRDWTVFAVAKLGYRIASTATCNAGTFYETNYDFSDVAFDTGLGAYWNFSQNWALRLEVGYFGLQVGADMQLK